VRPDNESDLIGRKSRPLPGHAGQTAGQAPAICPAAATAAPAGCDCPAGDAQLGYTAVNLSDRIGAETASGPIDPALAADWTRRRRRPGAWQHEHRRNIIFTPGTFRRFTETLVKEIDPEMRSAYALSANACERSTRSIRLRLSESAATASSAQITRSRAAWRTEMATRAAAQNGGYFASAMLTVIAEGDRRLDSLLSRPGGEGRLVQEAQRAARMC
jgi:hypothetical protein